MRALARARFTYVSFLPIDRAWARARTWARRGGYARGSNDPFLWNGGPYFFRHASREIRKRAVEEISLKSIQ